MLPLRALFLSLLVVSPLAAATVTERPISEARVGTASASGSGQVTWNGERFLTTWSSFRRGPQALVLDDAGRPLAETATQLPISAGTVFWRDGAWYVIGSGQGVYFGWIRLSADGVPLDLRPHPLETPHGSIGGTLWTGESLIAVWNVQDPATSKTLEAVVLVYDADLQLRETYRIGNWATSVRLYTDGSTAVVLFSENESRTLPLQGVSFRRDGQFLRQRMLDDISLGAGGTRGDGTGYFFLSTTASGSRTSYYLDESLVPQRNAASFTTGGRVLSSAGLSWDGSAYRYFYRTVSEIRLARIAADGTLLDDASVVAVGDKSESSSGMAAGVGMGTSILLYRMADTLPPRFDTHVLRLRAGHDAISLAAAPEVNLEHGAFAQTFPVATSSNTQSLVAWREQVSLTEPPRIYATRVANGEVRDPQSLLLGSLSIPYPGVMLASNGEGFVAAWTDPEGIITRHVAADGTVGPKTVIERFEKATAAPSLEVLSNGDGYLVAWADDYGALDRAYAVRLRADGTIVDTAPISLGYADGPIEGASDGSGYLLAWRGPSVVLSSGGTVTARPDMGVSMVHAAWWNGTSYSVLLSPAGPWDPDRVAQVAADGSVTTGASFPWLTGQSWAWGLFDACRGEVCSRARGTVEDGAYLLREERVTPAGFAYGNSVTVLPARLLTNEIMHAALFRTPQGRLWAAFERRLPEPPYAGISRIVITALDPSRARSVRH